MTGSGTEGDPYIITTKADLIAVANDLTAWYELGGNIDCESTDASIAGDFTGHFDGKDFTISNLVISKTDGADDLGLFDVLDDGSTVQNLTVAATITAVGNSDRLGILAGSCYEATITSVAVSGTITGGDDYIGGLAGFIYGAAVVSECSAAVNIAVGTAGDDYTGGFIGYAYGATISQCSATGNVVRTTGGNYAGGFIGNSLSCTITNCYARGNVTGYYILGGFIGKSTADVSVDNCYSTGLVTWGFDSSNGGFIGDATVVANITNCFWDTQTSGMTTSDGGTGKTTAQMKDASTFVDAGWDFDTIWGIAADENNGYPKHGAEESTVTTGIVDAETLASVRLNGSALGALISKVYFEYGTASGTYTEETAEQDYATTFTATITITAATTYYYRAVAKLIDDSLIYGSERYFDVRYNNYYKNIGAIDWHFSPGKYRQVYSFGGYLNRAKSKFAHDYEPKPDRVWFEYWHCATLQNAYLYPDQYIIFHTLIIPHYRRFYIGPYSINSNEQGGELRVVRWNTDTSTWDALPLFPTKEADTENFDSYTEVWDSYDDGGTIIQCLVINTGASAISGISAMVGYDCQYLPGGLP